MDGAGVEPWTKRWIPGEASSTELIEETGVGFPNSGGEVVQTGGTAKRRAWSEALICSFLTTTGPAGEREAGRSAWKISCVTTPVRSKEWSSQKSGARG